MSFWKYHCLMQSVSIFILAFKAHHTFPRTLPTALYSLTHKPLHTGQFTISWTQEAWSCFSVFACNSSQNEQSSYLNYSKSNPYFKGQSHHANSNTLPFHRKKFSFLPLYSDGRYFASFIKHLTYTEFNYILVHIPFAGIWSYNSLIK